MARVSLIGTGPLPGDDATATGFPQLRVAHFLQALRGAGHEVDVVLLGTGADGPPPLEDLRRRVEAFRPEVVVTAGPYEPARLGALVAGDRPLWVDVPGDPFAEAQAKAWAGAAEDPTREMWKAWLPALARADAFGAISMAQRHALLGQLGLLGRLPGADPARDPVRVVPVAYAFGDLPERPPRRTLPGEAPVVALTGGFNTWLDEETLYAGLRAAMDRLPGLRVVCTGGGIAGHHEAGFRAFRERVARGPHAARFTFHGWVPHGALPERLADAHLGVLVDRPGHEAELGSRTRIAFWIHQGLLGIATPASELARELAGMRLLLPIRRRDPGHLAGALVHVARHGIGGERVRRAQRWMASRFAPEIVARPLLEWVERPARLPAARDRAAELAGEVATLRSELAAIHRSPTWRVGGAADRLLRRGARGLERLLRRDAGDA